jgi:gluconate 5-dehydrogenase
LGNSSCCHSEGAPATEESVFPYSRSQILQSLGLHQDDASLFKSTHLETLTCPAYFVATEVAKVMKGQGGGAIVNVDSLNTYAPLKNVLPYAMTKNAVVALTRGLAMELGPSGIRVNSIAPGFILTDLSQKLWSDPTMQTWADANTPLGRLGEPQDMVGAAVFLASAASKFMSGQVVRVDGGFTAGFMWPIPEDGGQ